MKYSLLRHVYENVLPILYADAEFYYDLTPKINKSVLIASNLAKTLYMHFFIILNVCTIYLIKNQIQWRKTNKNIEFSLCLRMAKLEVT